MTERQQYVFEYTSGEQYKSRTVEGTDVVGIENPAADFIKVIDVDEQGDEWYPFTVSKYNYSAHREVRD